MSGHFVLVQIGISLIVVCSSQMIATAEKTDKELLTEVITEYESWTKTTTLSQLNVLHPLSQQDLSTWPSFTEQQFTEQMNSLNLIRQKLLKVNEDSLDFDDGVNYSLLMEIFNTFINGHRFVSYGLFNPISTLEGIPNSFPFTIKNIEAKNITELKKYVTFAKKFPTLINQIMSLMDKSIASKKTLYKNSLVQKYSSVPEQIRSLTAKPIKDTVFFGPFKKAHGFNDTEDYKNTLQDFMDNAVRPLTDALNRLANYLTNTYIPETRPHPGVVNLPGGDRYYEACLRYHLGTNMTAAEVHQIGLNEVKRILTEMFKITKGEPIRQFMETKLNGPKYYCQTKDEMLTRFRQITKDRILPTMKKIFNHMPKTEMEIVPLPSPGPSALYSPAPNDGKQVGQFLVNTFEPEATPTYNFMALALHEGYPGHHMQIAIQQETKSLPAFRRNFSESPYYAVPFAIPSFTDYVEGWGLYSEFLGVELGLYKQKQDDYDTEYEMLGRYGYEIWRAMRLVVDTGIHQYNWTRDRAVEYMSNYSTESTRQVEIEVDRYITWPGQACAYKIGEIEIRRLRDHAKKQLGEEFSVAAFHDFFLANGAMPMVVMEKLLNKWIDKEKAKETQGAASPHTNFYIILLLLLAVFAPRRTK